MLLIECIMNFVKSYFMQTSEQIKSILKFKRLIATKHSRLLGSGVAGSRETFDLGVNQSTSIY